MISIAATRLSRSVVLAAFILSVFALTVSSGCARRTEAPQAALTPRNTSNGGSDEQTRAAPETEAKTLDTTATRNPASRGAGSGTTESGSGSASMTEGSGGSGIGSGATEKPDQIERGYVIIKYWNDTVTNPPGGVEIVAQDVSWKPNAKAKSDLGRLGPIPLGRDVRLVVYPDGKKGPKIGATIRMSSEMDSRDVDAIHVELRDGQVRVMGNPVAGYEATGSRG